MGPTFCIVKRDGTFWTLWIILIIRVRIHWSGGTGKDILQGDVGDVIMGSGDVNQFEVFFRNDYIAADDCVHILGFEPEKGKLAIRFDEPIEQAANPDHAIIRTMDDGRWTIEGQMQPMFLPTVKKWRKFFACTLVNCKIFMFATFCSSPKWCQSLTGIWTWHTWQIRVLVELS